MRIREIKNYVSNDGAVWFNEIEGESGVISRLVQEPMEGREVMVVNPSEKNSY